jgi:hypothetical protein
MEQTTLKTQQGQVAGCCEHCNEHTANHTCDWDVVDHPPYGSDLTPSGSHLFGSLNKYVTAIRGNMKQAVTSWLQTLDTDSFYAGRQTSVSWRNKCFNVNGDCGGLVFTICYTCAKHALKSEYSSWHVCYVIWTYVYKNTAKTSNEEHKAFRQSHAAECEIKGWWQKHIKIEQERRFNKFSKHVQRAATLSIIIYTYINVSSADN